MFKRTIDCSRKALIFAFVLFTSALPLSAFGEGTMIFDDFSSSPQNRWSYVADTVMGGVSDGAIAFDADDGRAFVRLTGTVSTANNGGFIQVRRSVDGGFADTTQGLKLSVRGNGQTYYVFLRSQNATRPWHSYRASFVADDTWQEVTLPLASFTRSRDVLPEAILPADVTGIGIVAYGGDFKADLSVSAVTVY
jgi:hypothetical protein